jgi:hypothetical protein
MGWTESPPYFCASTETACDLANDTLQTNARYPEHPLKARAGASDGGPNPDPGFDTLPECPITQSHRRRLKPKPVAYVDVFVDDFCGLGQDHKMSPLVNQRRVLMHAIDKIFRPSDTLDKACQKEPISVSKLDKQDAAWQGLKRCLGWDYAAHSKNLLVASHRHEKATASLTEALSQKRASLQSWQSLIGQLRSLVPGIPGSEGQFSLLQEALVTRTEGRIKIDATV